LNLPQPEKLTPCLHGPDVFVEEVNDWRPFDNLTLTTLPHMPGAAKR
jgi:hypothetical protein